MVWSIPGPLSSSPSSTFFLPVEAVDQRQQTSSISRSRSCMSISSGTRASARLLGNAAITTFGHRINPPNFQSVPLRSFLTPSPASPLRRSQVIAQTRHLHLQRLFRPNSLRQRFQTPRIRRFESTKSSTHTPPTQLNSPEAAPSLSQRLKQLSKEYGWTAVGVYLALSALDFPFCFLAVRLLGTDRIGRWEHAIISGFWNIIGIPFPSLRPEPAPAGVEAGDAVDMDAVKREGPPRKTWDHGVEAAQAANQGEQASIWTQLALAYAVHKSFIFIRVPLTAAVLPSVVRTLRTWGWKVGRRTPKAIPSPK